MYLLFSQWPWIAENAENGQNLRTTRTGGSNELFDKNQNHPLFNAVCLYSHVQLTGVTPSPNAVEFFHNPSVSNFWLLPLSWKEEEYE